MTQTAPDADGRGQARIRRRNTQSHKAILDATTELLTAGGYRELTIEGVAARAGVGKATVYRWWASKAALVIEAMSAVPNVPFASDTGDLRTDLAAAVRRAIDVFTGSAQGAIISELAADLVRDPALSEQFRAQILRPRRSKVVQVVRKGIERGELPPDFDVELVLDMCAGAIFYRHVLSGEPVTDDLPERLVGLVLDAVT